MAYVSPSGRCSRYRERFSCRGRTGAIRSADDIQRDALRHDPIATTVSSRSLPMHRRQPAERLIRDRHAVDQSRRSSSGSQISAERRRAAWPMRKAMLCCSAPARLWPREMLAAPPANWIKPRPRASLRADGRQPGESRSSVESLQHPDGPTRSEGFGRLSPRICRFADGRVQGLLAWREYDECRTAGQRCAKTCPSNTIRSNSIPTLCCNKSPPSGAAAAAAQPAEIHPDSISGGHGERRRQRRQAPSRRIDPASSRRTESAAILRSAEQLARTGRRPGSRFGVRPAGRSAGASCSSKFKRPGCTSLGCGLAGGAQASDGNGICHSIDLRSEPAIRRKTFRPRPCANRRPMRSDADCRDPNALESVPGRQCASSGAVVPPGRKGFDRRQPRRSHAAVPPRLQHARPTRSGHARSPARTFANALRSVRRGRPAAMACWKAPSRGSECLVNANLGRYFAHAIVGQGLAGARSEEGPGNVAAGCVSASPRPRRTSIRNIARAFCTAWTPASRKCKPTCRRTWRRSSSISTMRKSTRKLTIAATRSSKSAKSSPPWSTTTTRPSTNADLPRPKSSPSGPRKWTRTTSSSIRW